MNESLKGNVGFEDGGLGKIGLHAVVGAGTAAIKGEDIGTGAFSAAVVGGDKGAQTGYDIATKGEGYNRQLHENEIKWLKDDKNIQEFAKSEKIPLNERWKLKCKI